MACDAEIRCGACMLVIDVSRCRQVFSPKGWDNIAQGNALGKDNATTVFQPEGLGQACRSPSGRNMSPPPSQGVALGHGVPALRAEETSGCNSQGVALGYGVPALRAEELRAAIPKATVSNKTLV